MAKIIGNTTATPNPRPDWKQTDPTKADYIKNKPTILTEEDVVELIEENGGSGSINKIQSDWNQTDETKVDYIKNKPDVSNGYKKTVSFVDLCKIEDASPILHTSYVLQEYDDGTIYYAVPRNFAPSTRLNIDGSVEIFLLSFMNRVIYFGGLCPELQEGSWEIVNESGDILISGDISLSLGYFRQEVVIPSGSYKLIIYADVNYIENFYVTLDSDVNHENVPEARPMTMFTYYSSNKYKATVTYKDVFYVIGVHPLNSPGLATFTYNADINTIINNLEQNIPSIDDLPTKEYVKSEIASMVDSAPETLNTLNELAAALGDDPNFATTIATQIGNKVDQSYYDEREGLIVGRFENELLTLKDSQPDWNETDTTKHGYIKNKPEIPSGEDFVTVEDIEDILPLADYIYHTSNGYRKSIEINGLCKIEDMSIIPQPINLSSEDGARGVFYIIPHNFANQSIVDSFEEDIEIIVPPINSQIIHFGGRLDGREDHLWALVEEDGNVIETGSVQSDFNVDITLTSSSYKLILYAGTQSCTLDYCYVSFDDSISINNYVYANPITRFEYNEYDIYKDYIDNPSNPIYVVGINSNGEMSSAIFTYTADINNVIGELDQKIPSDTLKYTEQTLTEEQKAQVRTNIGVEMSSFSGSYNDLTDKPTIPTKLSELTEDATHRVVTDDEKVKWNNKSDFSGHYLDLVGTPEIPSLEGLATEQYVYDGLSLWEGRIKQELESIYIQPDWNETDTTKHSYIKNKPDIPSINGLATETYVDEKIGNINTALEELHAYANYVKVNGVPKEDEEQ